MGIAMTRRSLRAAVLVCAAIALAPDARAQDAMIGDVKIALPVPAGYCQMLEAEPSDARMLGTIRKLLAGHNLLLAAYSDCGQLKEWRERKRDLIDDFSQAQTLESLKDKITPMTPEAAEQAICKEMSANGARYATGAKGDLEGRLAQLSKALKINETRFLGVIGEEPRVCYGAMLQKMHTQAGTDKVIVSAFGTSLIKGKIVYHYIFANDGGPGTVERLAAKEKAAMAAILAANGP